jgi:hypothetical protein
MRTQLGTDLLQAVASTGSRLKQSGIHPIQVLNLENLGSGVGAIFSEAAVHGDTMGVELHKGLAPGQNGNVEAMDAYVLAEQQLSTTAVKAFVAQFAVVGSDSVADLEAFDILTSVSNQHPTLTGGVH